VTSLVALDGRILPAAEASVSVFDRGFLYGDSVFEVFRTYGGVPFGFAEHMARLGRSAERALIPLPCSLEQFSSEVEQTIAATGNAETYVRVVLTRGVGSALGLSPSLGQKPLRVVMAMELPPMPAAMYEQGIGVISYRTERIADHTSASGAKLSNYLISVLATHEAEKAGASEAIIVDRSGQVVEGSTSNVFVFQGGVLVTPPESSGILMGITRQKVLEIARARHVAVEERAFGVETLESADEAFITSSIREVAPVVRIDGKSAGGGRPGPRTLELLEALRALAYRR
jgi:branched-chain amino acid aminotransferase